MQKLLSAAVTVLFFFSCNSEKEKTISFYKVSLACGADNEIGCGSRIKPLFLAVEKESSIKESWTNRNGTVLAFVWNENISQEKKDKTLQPLFEENNIEAEFISNEGTEKDLLEKFSSRLAPANISDKWYKGIDVDQLSFEEAKAMGDSATLFALKAGLLNELETASIKKEIEEYMKTELVKVRTLKELTSDETDLKWKQYGYDIYVKYIGEDRAEKVRDYFIDYQKKLRQQQSCCTKSTTSEITCPYCGHKKTETLPTDICLLKYTCENCKKEILAKEGDCCVFCSYGSEKCPSMQ